jgi:hypothetical protein
MKLRDVVVAIAAAAALVVVGIQIGRGVERVDGLAAKPAPAMVVATKNQSWNGIYGCPRAPREDLRPPRLPVRGSGFEVER